MLSVHVNYEVIEDRINGLYLVAQQATLPGLLGFALLGTLAARLVGRGYERKIEEANRTLGEGIIIRVESDPDLCPVLMDPMQFERILLNLSINARDAMEGRGTLTIRTRNCRKNENLPGNLTQCVMVEVEDTGTGIPENMHSKIFEPFFTTKPRDRGTGLGLASVQGVIQQHGGALLVENIEPHGARFQIILPKSNTEEAPADNSPDQEAQIENAREMRRNILIVEDDPMVGKVTRDILNNFPFDTKLVSDRQDALNLRKSTAPCPR